MKALLWELLVKLARTKWGADLLEWELKRIGSKLVRIK